MLPSKFGGEWCPKCYDEKKKAKAEGSGSAVIMEEINAINERLDHLISYLVKKLGKEE